MGTVSLIMIFLIYLKGGNNLITGSVVIDSELDDIVFEIPTSSTYECNVDLRFKNI